MTHGTLKQYTVFSGEDHPPLGLQKKTVVQGEDPPLWKTITHDTLER